MAALANPTAWYVGSDKYTGVTAWAALTSQAAGNLRRQLAAPAVGSERVFACIVAGTTLAAEPTWTITFGAKTAEAAGPTWIEVTGQPGVNGDITNSPTWPTSSTVALGQVIYDSTSGALQVVTTASGNTSGSKPTFSATAGVTTNDGSNVWTSLGAASNFAAFAAPHATISASDAATWSTGVGNKMFISASHAETAAATKTLTGGQGTAAAPNQYLCVPNNVAPPIAGGVTTGASVATTGANLLKVQNYGYYSGITFSSSGGGSNNANLNVLSEWIVCDNCTFTLATTNASPIIALSAIAANTGNRFNNCNFVFGNVGQKIQLGSPSAYADNLLTNCTFAATGSVPTTLFTTVNTGNTGRSIVRSSDLSNIAGTLLTSAGGSGGIVGLENCKLNGSVTVVPSGTFSDAGSPRFYMHNCDSGTKNYRFYEKDYLGSIQHETTIVDSTNPSSDGVTPISWNITTLATTGFSQPFVSPQIFSNAGYTLPLGVTHTATIVIASSSVLTSADIWMELEYLGNSGFPISSVLTTRAADALTTGATLTTNADTWGGSPAHVYQLQVTFTPNMAGVLKGRLFVAKQSVTIYVNPLLILV